MILMAVPYLVFGFFVAMFRLAFGTGLLGLSDAQWRFWLIIFFWPLYLLYILFELIRLLIRVYFFPKNKRP